MKAVQNVKKLGRLAGQEEENRVIFIKYVSLQWNGNQELQKGGLEGNEELLINCSRGKKQTEDNGPYQMQNQKPITMAGEFQRESGFWFKKEKDEAVARCAPALEPTPTAPHSRAPRLHPGPPCNRTTFF